MPRGRQRRLCPGRPGQAARRRVRGEPDPGRGAPSSPPPASAPGRLPLRPVRAYLQAIGRPGAETAPAAPGSRLPPHPPAAAPPAAVRGRRSPRRVPGPRPRRAVRSPGRSRLAGSGRGSRGPAWRGGAGRAGGRGAEARCAREAAGSGTEAGPLGGARLEERGAGGAGAPPRDRPRPAARQGAGSQPCQGGAARGCGKSPSPALGQVEPSCRQRSAISPAPKSPPAFAGLPLVTHPRLLLVVPSWEVTGRGLGRHEPPGSRTRSRGPGPFSGLSSWNPGGQLPRLTLPGEACLGLTWNGNSKRGVSGS